MHSTAQETAQDIMQETGHETIDLAQFNQVAEQVIELKKTDLALSLKQLTAYKDLLGALTVEQNLVYFKLLTEIEIEQNRYGAAQKTANKGLSVAKRLASPSILISELLYLKGFALESLGNIPQAAKEYKKGLEVAESLHSKVQVAAGLINLGAIAYLTDDLKRALVLLNDAYNIAGQTDDEELKGIANTELGIAYSHLRQDEQSMAYYQQSYVHFKKAGMLLAAHNSLNNIALNHIRNKNHQQAINVFNTIITESNKDTPSDSMFIVYSGMAWAYLKKADSNPDAAYQYLLMAKKYLQFTEKRDYQLQYYYDEANVLYELERLDDVLISITHIEKMLNNYQALSLIRKQRYVRIIKLKAKVFYQQKKFKQAYETQSKVIALTDKLYENEDNRSIAQVRLKLEAQQADKQNKILHSQQARHEASLYEATVENKQQRIYLIISALVVLALVWVLVKLIQSQHKLNIASRLDLLTGVINRRSLMAKSQAAFTRAKKNQTHLSVLMIDVDNFQYVKDIKGSNNNQSHHISDTVLAEIALLGEKMMRKSDIFGRFSSEEFVVCLPKTTMKSAIEIGERFRLDVHEHAGQFNSLEKVSISVGVATLADDNDFISLVKRAEQQLYQAKASDRNRVCG